MRSPAVFGRFVLVIGTILAQSGTSRAGIQEDINELKPLIPKF